MGLLLVLMLMTSCEAVDRVYHVAAVEETWNYAPNGSDLIGDSILKEKAKDFLERRDNRIGREYMKVIYKQYTDQSYSTEVPKPAYLGLLGPVLKAEVGDRFVVHFMNKASRNYTMHPHGVQYEKDSEGALYIDGTHGSDKADDGVPPGGNHTYIWSVRDAESPSADDPDCLPWFYHSHFLPEKDTNSGLLGPLITCKKGILDENGNSKDVDEEFVLFFTVMDENLSWYLKSNIEHFTNSSKVDEEDDDLKESNMMHAINGYLYNNMPTLRMCRGSRVTWYIMGLGTEVDMHGVYFEGQTLIQHGHRKETFSVFPAQAMAASMVPNSLGRWRLVCNVFDHNMAGMLASYQVEACDSTEEPPPSGKTRHYYISAEEEEWNYGPSGVNMDGTPLDHPESKSAKYFTQGEDRIGGKYKKARFVGYTDNTFRTRTTRRSDEEHLGILGPVIRAEVGDMIMVTFRNNATRNYTLAARGVKFHLSNQLPVLPGEQRLFTWTIPESYSPLEGDSACITYVYYSSSFPKDIYSGLLGPLLVCKKGSLTPEGKQAGVDKEFFLSFMVYDENESWYLQENKQAYCRDPPGVDNEDEEFKESNKMHAINGYSFGNLPGLAICRGQEVRWHVIGHGNEADIHTLQFLGNHFSHHQLHRSALPIFPGSLATLHMLADSLGEWSLFCRNHKHLDAGEVAKYNVTFCPNVPEITEAPPVDRRTYYIAAQEVEWDYIPYNKNHPRTGVPLTEDEDSKVFVKRGDGLIGSVYKKVVFREYTDVTFSTQKMREPDMEHLGLLGPLIRAEVDDEVTIVFKNLASRMYSLKAPQGARYLRDSDRGAVHPGYIRVYRWHIHHTAGPSSKDPACIVSAYFSDNDIYKDTNSGLVGPLVVCKKGTLRDNGRRRDVDREFVILFTVTDENHSWYLEENKQMYLDKPNETVSDFEESNKMHGINGLVYGNALGFDMYVGEKVVWYMLGLGEEVDIHTVHFHGTTVIRYTDVSHRSDVIGVFPGTAHVAEMIPHTAATWLLHCHVNDHITAGMETVYTVLPSSFTTALPTANFKANANIHQSSNILLLNILLICFSFTLF